MHNKNQFLKQRNDKIGDSQLTELKRKSDKAPKVPRYKYSARLGKYFDCEMFNRPKVTGLKYC